MQSAQSAEEQTGDQASSAAPVAEDNRSSDGTAGQMLYYFDLPQDRFPLTHMRPIGVGVQGAVW